ncbi:MAG: HEAT repeat domain-containing protein [Planctomycetes bacterium]|nr:HEAT repeat domain-containing protein [Planctomycetota bacterium]
MTRNHGGILLAALGLGAALLGGCVQYPARPGQMVTNPTTARQSARRVLHDAAGSPDGQVRAHALESLALTEGSAAGPLLLAALDDPAVAVRFVAAMGIGDVAYAPARPRLRQMADDAGIDKNVLCGVIYALHRLGDDTLAPHLGRLLYDASPEVRANAALAMGKFGSEAAVQPLNSRLIVERNRGVKLQIAESLALLGDQKSYGMLMNFSHIGEPHERMVALAALGRSGGLRAQTRGVLLWAIDETQPPPLRLVAGGALGQLGDRRAYWVIVGAIEDPKGFSQQSYDKPVTLSEEQKQQTMSLAALALGHQGEPAAVDVLVDLLGHANATIAVSAARSILMLLPEATAATAATQTPEVPAAPVEATPSPVRPAGDEALAPAMRTAPMRE